MSAGPSDEPQLALPLPAGGAAALVLGDLLHDLLQWCWRREADGAQRVALIHVPLQWLAGCLDDKFGCQTLYADSVPG
jgi:hypothetical protein